MRRVMAFSLRCSSNGSGLLEAQPAQAQEQPVRGVRLVLDIEQDLHDVAQGWDVPEPDADTRRGGRLGEDGLSSSFRVRVGSAASWFPACPVSTEHILVARHSASHSCTVLSVRSTISAMMPTSTPREAYRIASAFIRTST